MPPHLIHGAFPLDLNVLPLPFFDGLFQSSDRWAKLLPSLESAKVKDFQIQTIFVKQWYNRTLSLKPPLEVMPRIEWQK